MKKRTTRKAPRRHAVKTTKKTSYTIHKWVIFGTICLVVGYMVASTGMGVAKGKPGVTPTPTKVPAGQCVPTDSGTVCPTATPTSGITPKVTGPNLCDPAQGC